MDSRRMSVDSKASVDNMLLSLAANQITASMSKLNADDEVHVAAVTVVILLGL